MKKILILLLISATFTLSGAHASAREPNVIVRVGFEIQNRGATPYCLKSVKDSSLEVSGLKVP